ncbi:MAG: hypothetical protein AAF219_11215, partial [Myxococcota bacterium]
MLRVSLLFTVSVLGIAMITSCGDDDDSDPGGDSAATITLDVSGSFAAGEALRNAQTGASATVADDGTVTLEASSGDVVLLERAASTPAPFSWD